MVFLFVLILAYWKRNSLNWGKKSPEDRALYLPIFPAPKPHAWTEHPDKSQAVGITRQTPCVFLAQLFQNITFLFHFSSLSGHLAHFLMPWNLFLRGQALCFNFFNEFSSAPTHPLNHGFVRSREDTERCWCFWLVFMPSVPFFFFLWIYMFSWLFALEPIC